MMLVKRKTWSFILSFLFLLSCSKGDSFAPVEEIKWQSLSVQRNSYTVRKGDTLYAIAFKYDMDYRDLAKINHLKRPYSLAIGRIIHLHPSRRSQYRHRLKPKIIVKGSPHLGKAWVWPLKGRLLSGFLPQLRKKGIDIAGHKGDKIRAASSGFVAYAGNGLTGYGNLIIIKHSGEYLTAYGNNSKNLVKEGDFIKQGQIIADIGMINRQYYGVHFEIRIKGKPVNPLNYLKKVDR